MMTNPQIILDAIHTVLPDATVRVERFNDKYPKSGIINEIKVLFGKGEYTECNGYQFVIIDKGMHNSKMKKFFITLFYTDEFINEGANIIPFVKHQVEREVYELLKE